MDILAVGQSLGAGSLVMQVPWEGKKDTLVRLGGKNMGPIIYEQLADGPVRAVFSLHYPKWQALPGIPAIDIRERISIWGGQYYYESEVSSSGFPKDAKLVTGIVNLKAEKLDSLMNEKGKALYTHAKQSENDDQLGMPVAAGKKMF